LLIEFGQCCRRYLITPELCKELLLSWQVEVFVRLNLFLKKQRQNRFVIHGSRKYAETYPNIFHVEGDTIRRYSLVVDRLEDVISVCRIDEALPKLSDLDFKFVGCEHLVRKCRECQIEVVRKLGVCKVRGLGEGLPDPEEIGGEGGLQIRERCANVIADNKEKKGSRKRVASTQVR
jgi:hypothetical protein